MKTSLLDVLCVLCIFCKLNHYCDFYFRDYIIYQNISVAKGITTCLFKPVVLSLTDTTEVRGLGWIMFQRELRSAWQARDTVPMTVDRKQSLDETQGWYSLPGPPLVLPSTCQTLPPKSSIASKITPKTGLQVLKI